MSRATKTKNGGLQTALAAEEGIGEVLVSNEQISERVAEIGEQITRDYQGRAPLLVVILKGGVMFASDLCRAIDLPVEIDFMAVSSYGNNTSSSGVVRIMKDLDVDIGGRDVILIEDIVDSGLTLQYLRKSLKARGPASLAVCTLLLRTTDSGSDGANDQSSGGQSSGGQSGASQSSNGAALNIDYIGFELPPVWVVGYGLDIAQRFRNLPDIRAYDTPH